MDEFLLHLDAPAPAFRCADPEDETMAIGFTARLTHELRPPASRRQLGKLKKWIPAGAEQLEQFYARHDGADLYCGNQWAAEGPGPSIRFAPVKEWKSLNREWREWIEDLEPEEQWDFQKDGVAFGEIVGSGNFFVLWDGKVVYSSHDGDEGDALAPDFFGFLNRIKAEPAQFLDEMGCYSRFLDGETETQWIPREYVADLG